MSMEPTWADTEEPRISLRARRTITVILIVNLVAIAALLMVMIPAGNRAVLYKVQNWSEPWCRPFGCDRG